MALACETLITLLISVRLLHKIQCSTNISPLVVHVTVLKMLTVVLFCSRFGIEGAAMFVLLGKLYYSYYSYY